MKTIKTELLEIAYFDDGPPGGQPVLLLHGWPDDAYGMKPLADRLNAVGFRAIVPWLRGFGPTRFRDHKTFRDGRGVALAQDAIDLLDALKIERTFLVGHDWGARAGYNLAAIAPERLGGLITLGLQYTPNGNFDIPSFEQARMWWYQWFVTTHAGAEKVRQDPVGFARLQWEAWSPAGWFKDADFAKTAESFLNPDWVPITLHGYRSRWRNTPVDHRYDDQQAKIERTDKLNVQYWTIAGDKDGADAPRGQEDRLTYHSTGHELVVFEGIGHFPMREALDRTFEVINVWLFDHVADPNARF
jgi:pimeloyl-ACP methyl ester carboxylesterase